MDIQHKSLPPSIKAVAFDMDGLIFDTEALFFRVSTEILAARGKVFTQEMMAAMIGRPAAVAGPALVRIAELDEPPEMIMTEAKRRFEAIVDTEVRTMPGLHHLLTFLEDGEVPKAVATSTRYQEATRLLDYHNLLPRFSFVLGGDQVSRGKPDPEIYLTTAERLGVSPRSMLVLEDSPAGVNAAKAAGAFVVAIPHQYSPIEQLGIADRIITRLDHPDLIQIITG